MYDIVLAMTKGTLGGQNLWNPLCTMVCRNFDKICISLKNGVLSGESLGDIHLR